MRKLKKKLNPKRKVTMTVKEIDNLKEQATKRAVKITHLFPLWVLRTKYGFGEKRLKDFQKEYVSLWNLYQEGYVSLEDISGALEEEVGINIDIDL